MNDNASFGYWIRRRRKALDLTQDELARRVGCSAITIRKIEADERRPSHQVAALLADVLGVTPSMRATFLKAARAELSAARLTDPAPAQEPPPGMARAHIALPAPLTSLIGREQELAQAAAILRRAAARLLTLSGPGGVGKTRLALALAASLAGSFADGIWFVALAPIRDPQLVLTTIAQALGVKESGSQPLGESLAAFLKKKQALILLDNFEQVMAAAPFIADLLASVPNLKVLATSRVLLRISGEHEFAVSPLSLPNPQQRIPAADILQYAAVELFVQRAQAARSDFALGSENARVIAAICARLDGLPLAIELAAARSKLFAPAALLGRLESRLATLTSGPRDMPARQQTLRSAIDWSYDLLEADEKRLFAQLGVFAGGCTIEAVEAVCQSWDSPLMPDSRSSPTALDSLALLVDSSLLQRVAGEQGEPRFAMLETMREYALERLERSGAAEAVRKAHAAYYLALAERAAPKLTRSGQEVWLERLRCEHDNMRAVIGWSLDTQNMELAARVAGALWRFWSICSYWSEGRQWLERALVRAAELPVSVQALAFQGAGVLALSQDDYQHAIASLEAGLASQRELKDQRGVATSLIYLGAIFLERGEADRAQHYTEECLALRRGLGDRRGIATALNNLGNIALSRNDFAKAQAFYSESLVLCRAAGDTREIANTMSNMGLSLFYQDEHEQAMALYTESLPLFQKVGDQAGEANLLGNMGALAYARDDLVPALAYMTRSLKLFHELDSRRGIAECFERLAYIAVVQLQATRAARLLGAAVALRDAIGSPLSDVERSEHEQATLATRAQLGPSAFEAAWAAGRALALEQAIGEALQENLTPFQETAIP